MAIIDNILKRLPGIYKKVEDSNVYKLVQVFTDDLELIEKQNGNIKDIRDVNKAYGKHLDKIGDNVQQPRGALNDEKYRLLIKAKIARNISAGTIGDIVDVISTLFDLEDEEINIIEREQEEPASIYIDIPLKPLGEFGLTQSQFILIINNLLAAGVRSYTRLKGTYRLGDLPDDRTIYDYNHGLSNLYDDSLFAYSYDDEYVMNRYVLPGIYDGGKFSAWYSPPDITEMPGWE